MKGVAGSAHLAQSLLAAGRRGAAAAIGETAGNPAYTAVAIPTGSIGAGARDGVGRRSQVDGGRTQVTDGHSRRPAAVHSGDAIAAENARQHKSSVAWIFEVSYVFTME